MWRPLIRCSIVGGVIVFLWYLCAWMIIPAHKILLNEFTNESEVVSTVLQSAPKNGIYVAPSLEGQMNQKKVPFLFVSVQRGVQMADLTRPIVIDLITQIVGAFLITYLLLCARPMRYWRRVSFVTIVGLTVAILSKIPLWNWWHFAPIWVTLTMLYIVIGWFLGGIVIAKLVKD